MNVSHCAGATLTTRRMSAPHHPGRLGDTDTGHRDEHDGHHPEAGEVLDERLEEEPQPFDGQQVAYRERLRLADELRKLGGLAGGRVVDGEVAPELLVDVRPGLRRHGGDDLVPHGDSRPGQDRRQHGDEGDEIDEQDGGVRHLVADAFDPVQHPGHPPGLRRRRGAHVGLPGGFGAVGAASGPVVP